MGEINIFTQTAGVDYPRNLVEFDDFFTNEDACRKYLERLRWPQGFVCRSCGQSGQPWHARRDVYLCRWCRAEGRLTAGTIFEGTRKPLRLWFRAMWDVTSQKYGANALGLQRVLGLGNYTTAWSWLHKLLRAMVRPERDCLRGVVEVDETYVGGEEVGVVGRQTIKKAIVVIAVEIKDIGFGRIRLQHVSDVSAESLLGFICNTVEQGSIVRTDSWSSYGGLGTLGFDHRPIVLSNSSDPAHVHMPGVHRIASLLKRWLLGTLQGSISQEQLPYYLDEFTFRFNRRTSHARGMLFYRLVEQALQVDHTSTKDLFKGTGRGKRRLPGGVK